MKYLNSYRLFESNNPLREEVKELLANLEDDGFLVTFTYMGNDNGYIYIKKESKYGKDRFFNVDEVRGDISRMCEFLGDRYLCDINIVGSGSMLKAKPVTLYQFQEREFKTVYVIRINLFSTKDDTK
jgi:hypothetical protein